MKFIYIETLLNKGFIIGKVRWKTHEQYYGIMRDIFTKGVSFHFDTVSQIYTQTIDEKRLNKEYYPEEKLPIAVMKMIVDPFFEIDLGKWLTKNELELCEIL